MQSATVVILNLDRRYACGHDLSPRGHVGRPCLVVVLIVVVTSACLSATLNRERDGAVVRSVALSIGMLLGNSHFSIGTANGHILANLTSHGLASCILANVGNSYTIGASSQTCLVRYSATCGDKTIASTAPLVTVVTGTTCYRDANGTVLSLETGYVGCNDVYIELIVVININLMPFSLAGVVAGAHNGVACRGDAAVTNTELIGLATLEVSTSVDATPYGAKVLPLEGVVTTATSYVNHNRATFLTKTLAGLGIHRDTQWLNKVDRLTGVAVAYGTRYHSHRDRVVAAYEAFAEDRLILIVVNERAHPLNLHGTGVGHAILHVPYGELLESLVPIPCVLMLIHLGGIIVGIDVGCQMIAIECIAQILVVEDNLKSTVLAVAVDVVVDLNLELVRHGLSNSYGGTTSGTSVVGNGNAVAARRLVGQLRTSGTSYVNIVVALVHLGPLILIGLIAALWEGLEGSVACTSAGYQSSRSSNSETRILSNLELIREGIATIRGYLDDIFTSLDICKCCRSLVLLADTLIVNVDVGIGVVARRVIFIQSVDVGAVATLRCYGNLALVALVDRCDVRWVDNSRELIVETNLLICATAIGSVGYGETEETTIRDVLCVAKDIGQISIRRIGCIREASIGCATCATPLEFILIASGSHGIEQILIVELNLNLSVGVASVIGCNREVNLRILLNLDGCRQLSVASLIRAIGHSNCVLTSREACEYLTIARWGKGSLGSTADGFPVVLEAGCCNARRGYSKGNLTVAIAIASGVDMRSLGYGDCLLVAEDNLAEREGCLGEVGVDRC